MFILPEWKDAESIQLFTDTSGSFGFGRYFYGAWFRGDWQPHQQLPKCSIQWQELMVAALTWGHLLEGQRIRFHCDNLPIVQAQLVLQAPWSNGAEDFVLYCGTAQLHSPWYTFQAD